MDMYSPYMSLVKRCFPNAVIIIDRFHIIQHLNRALNSYRVQVMNDIRYTRPSDYRKLKKLWKLILKNREDLDFSNYKSHRLFEGLMTEEMMVKYLLNIDERFALIYKLINDLKFAIKHHHYERFIEVLEKSRHNVLPRKVRTTVNTLMLYKDDIYYSCLYTISNGPIEGINNKIKNIERSGYGYRILEILNLGF